MSILGFGRRKAEHPFVYKLAVHCGGCDTIVEYPARRPEEYPSMHTPPPKPAPGGKYLQEPCLSRAFGPITVVARIRRANA